MCCFHVKQNLDKRIKSMRIYKEYRENFKFQKVVRMIGSLQFVPKNLIAKSIQVIKAVIGFYTHPNLIKKTFFRREFHNTKAEERPEKVAGVLRECVDQEQNKF